MKKTVDILVFNTLNEQNRIKIKESTGIENRLYGE